MQNHAIRAFFAVEVGENCQLKIEKIQSDLKNTFGEFYKWVKKEQMHLTLKFFPKLNTDDISRIINDLEGELQNITSFDMEVSGIGAFPNIKKPRVLWVGINYPKELATINDSIQELCEKYGYGREARPFSPHLTIARIRNRTPYSEYKRISDHMKSLKIGSICTINLKKISLIQSTLTPEGPIYEVIKEIIL